jgi:hypothetical protein
LFFVVGSGVEREVFMKCTHGICKRKITKKIVRKFDSGDDERYYCDYHFEDALELLVEQEIKFVVFNVEETDSSLYSVINKRVQEQVQWAKSVAPSNEMAIDRLGAIIISAYNTITEIAQAGLANDDYPGKDRREAIKKIVGKCPKCKAESVSLMHVKYCKGELTNARPN